jgi:hypothetical protein
MLFAKMIHLAFPKPAFPWPPAKRIRDARELLAKLSPSEYFFIADSCLFYWKSSLALLQAASQIQLEGYINASLTCCSLPSLFQLVSFLSTSLTYFLLLFHVFTNWCSEGICVVTSCEGSSPMHRLIVDFSNQENIVYPCIQD